MKIPDITVVVGSYNRASLLKNAIESLICQETGGRFSYELLVIDDGSTDDTSSIVKEVARCSSIPIKYLRENGYGIAHARNRGIQESTSEWIAFFDDDQLAEPNWLRELFESASKLRSYCVGGSRELCLLESELSELSPICRAILGEIKGGNEPVIYSGKVFPCTGNVLINKKVFKDIGLFDESLKWGGSDLDFFLRVRKAGIETWFIPRAVVHHVIPSYRLSDEYMIWRSLMTGINLAMIDYKELGFLKTTLAGIARIGQALLVNLPLMLWAHILSDQAERLRRKCLLWRAVGFVRQSLFLIAPRLFSQKHFFSKVKFRKERSSFPKDPICTGVVLSENKGCMDSKMIQN